jgi:FkbM family methyltransferase
MNKKLRSSISIKNAILLKSKYLNISNVSVKYPQIKTINRILILQAKVLFKKILSPIKKIAKFCFKPILLRMKNYLNSDLEHHFFTQSRQLELLQHNLLTQSNQLNLLQLKLDRIEEYTRRVAIPCASEEILIKTQVGFILCSSEDHALVACLLDTGDIEIGTRLLIQNFLNSGDTFVDIGANIGIHTLAAARAMKGEGKIIAIEPFKNAATMLRKSVRLNGFLDIVEIHQVAISNDAGTHALYLSDTSEKNPILPQANVIYSEQTSVDVTMVRLDDLLPHRQRIDLLKIGVEGAEIDVVQSGLSLIKENPEIAIIVEFNPLHLMRTGKSLDKWLHEFRSLGLCYKVIDEHTGILKEYNENELMEAYSSNLFLAKPNSSAWGRAKK